MPVIGQANVNTLAQFQPGNSALRANTINGIDLANTIGTLPKNQAMGLQDNLSNLIALQEGFKYDIFTEREVGSTWRWIFTPFVLPQHLGTLSARFDKFTDVDERPETAAVRGLEGWNPQLNEVSIDGYSTQVSTAAYGRYCKNQKYYEMISAIDWAVKMAQSMTKNALATLDNLAGVRAYEGASKIYVKSIAPYDDSTLEAAVLSQRITLGAALTDVAAPLSWASLDVAKYLMRNYPEVYTVVNQTSGAKEDAKRIRQIAGYNGDSYLVVVGPNGYDQLLNDPQIRNLWVKGGGLYAAEVQNRTLGTNAPFYEFTIRKSNRVITLTQADGKILTDGTGDLEVAFVIGGGNAVIGVELTLEGSTESFSVGYNDDRKYDPMGLLSFYGWITVTDFTIIHPECIYAIPYIKKSPIKAGQIDKPSSPTWKK